MDITPAQAKKIVKAALKEWSYSNKLKAKTVSFQDLARCSRVFVSVLDWKGTDNAWLDLKAIARDNGFYIQSWI